METKQSYNYEYRHLNNDSISKLLTPNWVTGFTDAEGCFSVILTKLPTIRKWRIIVSFEINLHSKDISVLYKIKDFFGVGSINSRNNKIKIFVFIE